MNYLKSVYKKWDELSQDSRNQNLYIAIDSWCRTILLPQEAVKQIPNSIRQLLNEPSIIKWAHLISKEIFSWTPHLSISFKKDWQRFQEDIPRKMQEYINSEEYHPYQEERQKMNIEKTRFILFIAFVLTGTALLLYYLNQKASEEHDQSLSRSQIVTSAPREEQLLVLVINARREEIFRSLDTNGCVIRGEGELLYQATEALWMGTQAVFSQSELKKWFSGERSVQKEEESEYDIRLVKIDLVERVSGFEPNVNQVDRNDAFKKLPELSKRVEVSPRLSSRAYENTGVYSR